MQAPLLNIVFTHPNQVSDFAQKHNLTLLILDDYVIDVTKFAEHHPGGKALLHTNQLERIDEQLKFHHPLTLHMATTMAIGSFKKDISRIIDPQKAFLSQVWDLTHEQYIKVVNSPYWLLQPSPRMFQSNFLQFFTHTKWYQVLPMPWIIIAYLFYMVPSWQNFNLAIFILTAVVGFFSFTLVEYLLHRFLFHCEESIPDMKIARFLHFMLHGIHHMLPIDPDRLVFPPILALTYITIGYYTVLRVFYIQDWIIFTTFWSFFLIGYMTYDIMHYSLHHIDTSQGNGGYFHRLQQYHNQHHFGAEHAGYGVSSKFWDIIFNTGFKTTKKE